MQTVFCNRLRRLRREESGVGLIEFALSSMVLVTVLVGIMDASRALYVDHFVSNAAREATRYAMVRGSTWAGTSCSTTSAYSCMATSSDVTKYVSSLAPTGVSTDALTVTTTWTGKTPTGSNCASSNGTNSQGCVVNVKVDYSFNFAVPFLPKNTLVLSSSSAIAVTQ